MIVTLLFAAVMPAIYMDWGCQLYRFPTLILHDRPVQLTSSAAIMFKSVFQNKLQFMGVMWRRVMCVTMFYALCICTLHAPLRAPCAS